MNNKNLSKTSAWTTAIQLQKIVERDHDCHLSPDDGCSACDWIADNIDNLKHDIKRSGLMSEEDKKELVNYINSYTTVKYAYH